MSVTIGKKCYRKGKKRVTWGAWTSSPRDTPLRLCYVNKFDYVYDTLLRPPCSLLHLQCGPVTAFRRLVSKQPFLSIRTGSHRSGSGDAPPECRFIHHHQSSTHHGGTTASSIQRWKKKMALWQAFTIEAACSSPVLFRPHAYLPVNCLMECVQEAMLTGHVYLREVPPYYCPTDVLQFKAENQRLTRWFVDV